MLIPGQLAPVDGSEARSRLSDSLFPTPRLQGIDPGQVAPLLVVVHAETEHETIGQFNAVEIGPDALDQAVVLLGAQAGDIDFFRSAPVAVVAHFLQGVAFVEDVVDQQHDAVFQRHHRLAQPAQLLARGRAAVAGGVNVVEFQVGADRQRVGQSMCQCIHAVPCSAFSAVMRATKRSRCGLWVRPSQLVPTAPRRGVSASDMGSASATMAASASSTTSGRQASTRSQPASRCALTRWPMLPATPAAAMLMSSLTTAPAKPSSPRRISPIQTFE